jgi:DNA-directed RNA polymerase specialized sigma24 family protein
MTASSDFTALTLAGLTHRCAQETELFFKRHVYDPAYCYELFRRALLERNQRAYECLYTQYQPLVAGWVERHPSFPGADEEVQYFVNRAFEKMWHALGAEKFSRFGDLKALLSYLKLCTHSAVIDFARARRLALLDEESSDAALTIQAGHDDVEEEVIDEGAQQEFWRQINLRLADEEGASRGLWLLRVGHEAGRAAAPLRPSVRRCARCLSHQTKRAGTSASRS